MFKSWLTTAILFGAVGIGCASLCEGLPALIPLVCMGGAIYVAYCVMKGFTTQ